MTKKQRSEMLDALAIIEYSLIQTIENNTENKNIQLIQYDEITFTGSSVEFYSVQEFKESGATDNHLLYIFDDGMISGIYSLKSFENAGGKLLGILNDRPIAIGFWQINQEQALTIDGSYLTGIYRSNNKSFFFCRGGVGDDVKFISAEI